MRPLELQRCAGARRICSAALALSLLVCALGAGCKSPPPEESLPVLADGGTGTPPRSAGVKVPLPEGWHAEIGEDKSFLAGPLGHTVLRVDLRPGAAAAFPSAAELQHDFAQGLPPNTKVAKERATEEADFVALRIELWRLNDGGEDHHHHDVFLGARKVGKDLFLCASEPGASEVELDQAEQSCRDLSFSTP